MDRLVRWWMWVLFRIFYRFEARGLANVPARGGAVIVCNHVSWVDALLIAASTPRPVRFVMDHRIFATPVLGWLFRASRAIPIAPRREAPEVHDAAFAAIERALRAGELVCIFPEGKITSTGAM